MRPKPRTLARRQWRTAPRLTIRYRRALDAPWLEGRALLAKVRECLLHHVVGLVRQAVWQVRALPASVKKPIALRRARCGGGDLGKC